jgi:hypothetical protein
VINFAVLKKRLPTANETLVELVTAVITAVAVEVSVVGPPTFEAVTATFIN